MSTHPFQHLQTLSTIHPCCQRVDELIVLSPHLAMCPTCQARHYSLKAEPGRFAAMVSPLATKLPTHS